MGDRQNEAPSILRLFKRDVKDMANLELLGIQLMMPQETNDLAQALEAEALRAQALLYWIAQKRIRILGQKPLLDDQHPELRGGLTPEKL